MTKSPARRISNEGAVAQFKVLKPLSPGEAEIVFSAKTLIVRNSHMSGQNQRSQNAFSVTNLTGNTTHDGQISQT